MSTKQEEFDGHLPLVFLIEGNKVGIEILGHYKLLIEIKAFNFFYKLIPTS